jgi:hypothetical protein
MQGTENGILPEMLKIIATGIPQSIEEDCCYHVISILEPSKEACLQGLCNFIDSRDVDKFQKQGSCSLGSGLLFFSSYSMWKGARFWGIIGSPLWVWFLW